MIQYPKMGILCRMGQWTVWNGQGLTMFLQMVKPYNKCEWV